MNSEIVEYPNYSLGAMNFPRAFRYDHTTGDWYVQHTDGRIYNSHPREGNYWPLRFQVREHDGNFHHVKDLFNQAPHSAGAINGPL